jgi:exopolysaccharide production protein ExoZ
MSPTQPLTGLPPRPRLFYSVQCLRAIAALAVVLYHTQLLWKDLQQPGSFSPFGMGYLGVDLFFVISGFIITHTSRAQLGRPGLFASFLRKRFLRIYPMYWLCLSLVMVYIALRQGAGPAPGGVFQPGTVLANVFLVPSDFKFLSDSWSLSHEIYFYLLFGLLLLSRRFVLVLGFVLGGTLLQAYWWLRHEPGFATGWLTDLVFSPFNLEFGLGILLAQLVGKRPAFGVPVCLLVAFSALTVISQTGLPSTWHRVGWAGALSFALIYLLTSWEIHSQPRFSRVLVRLGDASYLLYLLHGPGLVAFDRLTVEQPYRLVAFGFCVPILCAISLGLHRWVEVPLLHWLQPSRPRQVDVSLVSIPEVPLPTDGT